MCGIQGPESALPLVPPLPDFMDNVETQPMFPPDDGEGLKNKVEDVKTETAEKEKVLEDPYRYNVHCQCSLIACHTGYSCTVFSIRRILDLVGQPHKHIRKNGIALILQTWC